MKTKRNILIILIITILIGAGFGIKAIMDIQNEQKILAALNIQEIDLTKVADGNYEGSYDSSLIKVKVVVEVNNHKISYIDLVQHENGKGTPAEVIIPEVINTQSLKVDAVTGATSSSKAILKAIENAINQKT